MKALAASRYCSFVGGLSAGTWLATSLNVCTAFCSCRTPIRLQFGESRNVESLDRPRRQPERTPN